MVNGRETRTDLAPEFEGPKFELTPKQKCEAKGGTWDEERQVCILPETKKEVPQVTPTTPEVFRDKKGELSGIEIDGKTYLGLSPADVQQIARRKLEKTQAPAGTAPVGTAQAAAELERAQLELQTTGQPVRRELDPTLQTGEDIPVFGPLLIKIRKILGSRPEGRSLLDVISDKEATGEEFFELQPEELKTVALTIIERNEIEKGLTNSEKFGSFVESLSLGGLSNFAAEKPSENIQTILRELKTQKTRATNAEIKVKDGTWRQTYGEEVIDEIDNNIQRMESRIKLLLQDSPEFKFDSDGVN